MRRASLALPLLLLLAAGCLDGSPDGDEVGEALAAEGAIYDAVEAEIGEPLEGGGLAEGAPDHLYLERVALERGSHALPQQGPENFIESAVKGGYAYLCRTGNEQGLVIFDVSDIEHPVETGYLRLNAGFEADIEVSDDGHWAFWETQRAYLGVPPDTPDPLEPTSAGGTAPHGIHVVDVSDKANPVWVSYTPIAPDGPHSITYASINGEHYVLASTYAYAYNHDPYVAVPGLQRLVILRLDESGPVPTLTQVAEYVDPAATEEVYPSSGERFPHDVTVQVHPITNQTLAYIAYWDLGIVIVDLSDPANPVRVGAATDFGPAPYADVHMGRPFPHLIAGRHVTVAEPEISGQPDSGYITFFDTTDPTDPTYISSWILPGNLSNAETGGPHYFDTGHGRVALAHYAAGFWVIDVHDEANLLNPRTVAYAMPEPATGTSLPGPLGALGGTSAFDAWWGDATHVVASESSGGLAVFRYTGPTPAPDEVLAAWP